jgi:hypothetical protein
MKMFIMNNEVGKVGLQFFFSFSKPSLFTHNLPNIRIYQENRKKSYFATLFL